MTQNEIALLAKSINAQVIETHISWVLLTNTYAYKIKKSVKTSFLDFSTLSARKFYCNEELRLNKEFTTDIYLKVCPVILNQNSEIELSGDGKIIDYALQMKRLNPGRQLSMLLRTNKVKRDEVKQLGILIASVHQKAKSVEANKVPVLAHELEDLIIETEKSPFVSSTDNTLISESVFQAENFLAQYQNEFTQRKKNGAIKEVHGDLHSENIFILHRPVLFDRIEFNKSFRTIDVLHELAYLSTDLDFYERSDLSDVLLKTYLQETGIKFTVLEKKIFYFYKAYAANVRGKVKLLLAGQKGKEGKKYRQQFKKYIELMKKYIKELDK